MAANLDNYVEVKDRIAALYAKYPEASIQGEWEFKHAGEVPFLIVYRSTVYRTPEDRRPAIAYASEPYPGTTPFTRNSELMNAETSAIGRAIAALGFEVHKSVASRDEVQARQPGAQTNGKAAVGRILLTDVQTLMERIADRRDDGLTFDDLSLILGSVGVDAPSKRSIQSVQERIESLTPEQGTALTEALA